MLIIKNEKGENIERMLKRYKRKFDRTKVIRQLRDREQFTKPSERKRAQLEKAKYVQKKFNSDDE